MMNILFIDDEGHLHPVLSSLLQSYGEKNNRQVTLNGLIDPVQGLFEAANHGHKYDLVLLDVRLPDLPGTEIYRRIIAAQPQLRQRILFVTGYRQELEADFPNHDLPVLDKPFRYEQLEAQINRMLS